MKRGVTNTNNSMWESVEGETQLRMKQQNIHWTFTFDLMSEAFTDSESNCCTCVEACSEDYTAQHVVTHMDEFHYFLPSGVHKLQGMNLFKKLVISSEN